MSKMNSNIVESMDRARESFSSNKVDTAINQLNVILETNLMPSERMDALQLMGSCLTSQGNLYGALDLHKKVLFLNPQNFNSLFSIGTIYKDLHLYRDAISSFKKILEIDQSNNMTVKYSLCLTLNDYANSLKFNGQLFEAEGVYRESLSFYPQNSGTWYNLGVLYSEMNKLIEAEKCYHFALQYNERYVEALCNLGVLSKMKGDNKQAIDYYRRALNLTPNLPLLKNNMAIALNDYGIQLKKDRKAKEGIKAMKLALFYFPEYTECYYNLGIAYSEMDRNERAIYYYKLCVHFNPRCAEAYNNLGVLYKRMENVTQAIECYKMAVQLNGTFVETINNLGVLYSMQGNFDVALEYIKRAILVNPKYADAYNNYGVVLRDEGRVDEAIEQFDKCLSVDPNNRNAGQNRLMAFTFKYGEWGKEHRIWGDQFQKLFYKYTSWQNDKNPNRQLRIGYVSPDFFTHSVSYFIEAPLLNVSSDFEVFCYSNVVNEDQKTRYFQSLTKNWRNIQMKSTVEVSEMIIADGIDILVELAGHSANNRLDVMAMKPAPLGITWIGYPNTTGLSTIDYRIVDQFTDPIDMAQETSEKLIRLNHFLCYSPGHFQVEVSPPPYFKNEFVTFGTFNNMAKITPWVLKCWIKIMKLVDNSKLLLKSKSFCVERIKSEFLKKFEDEGISSSRIVLMPLINGHQNHLTAYSFIDIQLDVFPYAGTTTSCEGLYMGVPLVTMEGNSHAHNVGVSLLQAIGYPELIAKDQNDYIKRVVDLANDPERLMTYRCDIRKKMLSSDLCDGKTFTQQLESTYRNIWEIYCQK